LSLTPTSEQLQQRPLTGTTTLREIRYRTFPHSWAFRPYKALIGRGLHARTLSTQKTEAAAGCRVLNIMTGLGMPVSRRVA
jgi:hypothetical protein